MHKNGIISYNLPYILYIILTILALIPLIKIVIISVIKLVYSLNKLIRHRKEFEVIMPSLVTLFYSEAGNSEIIPSSGPYGFINSPLEGWELECSPLETILSSILSLNVSVLLLFIILLYLIFYRYILSSNKDLIWRAINYILLKFNCKEETIVRTKSFFSKGAATPSPQLMQSRQGDGPQKYNTVFIFIFISILLLIILVFNIFVIIELKENIDKYVNVYNYLYEKCPLDQITSKNSTGIGSDINKFLE
jgi:hypothetical protein